MTAPAREGRLPDATALGPVRLQVADAARSLAFYRDLLGFDATAEPVDGRHPLRAADGRTVLELQERPGARPAPSGGRPGLFHVAVLLPDRAALGRILARFVERHTPLGAADHLVSEALYLTDPDGLGVEIYADRPRASWPRDGDDLRMATEPLDGRGLLDAAGDTPWSGMPADTRVGHVHLHVSDLARARAFYGEALGFEETVASFPGASFLSAGGYHHHLGLNTWARDTQPAPPEDARLLHWTVLVPTRAEREAAAARMEAAGHAVRRADDGAVWLEDPWGTALRLSVAAD